MLMTEHNLWFYQRLMQAMRDAIGDGRMRQFADAFLKRYIGSPAKAGAQGSD